MGRVEPKNTSSAVPVSSITAHLDRLAEEVVREGWTAVRCYEGPHPLIRVFDASVPHFGESVRLLPGTRSPLWWYRSSTGEDLAPHTKPILAAKRVTRILLPYVTAALAARTHQAAPRPRVLAEPGPSHAVTIAELQERFEGVVCWWGAATREWWAIIPGGTRWRIVNAPDPDGLLQIILKDRSSG